MKKVKKLKDELSRKDSKRIEKKPFSQKKKKKLNPEDSNPPKYRHTYLNDEEE